MQPGWTPCIWCQASPSFPRNPCLWTVSYTHLDVYKRQCKQLRESGYTGIIIFLTAFKEYVFDGYDVQAFNYLLKPINLSLIHISEVQLAGGQGVLCTDSGLNVDVQLRAIESSFADLLGKVEMCIRDRWRHPAAWSGKCPAQCWPAASKSVPNGSLS